MTTMAPQHRNISIALGLTEVNGRLVINDDVHAMEDTPSGFNNLHSQRHTVVEQSSDSSDEDDDELDDAEVNKGEEGRVKAPVETTANYNKFDVLLGRGRAFQLYPGNRRFHSLINSNADRYAKSSIQAGKWKITMEIVETVLAKGRFLKPSKAHGWTVVSLDTARQKVAHALQYQKRRQTAKELKQQAKQQQLQKPLFTTPDMTNIIAATTTTAAAPINSAPEPQQLDPIDTCDDMACYPNVNRTYYSSTAATTASAATACNASTATISPATVPRAMVPATNLSATEKYLHGMVMPQLEPPPQPQQQEPMVASVDTNVEGENPIVIVEPLPLLGNIQPIHRPDVVDTPLPFSTQQQQPVTKSAVAEEPSLNLDALFDFFDRSLSNVVDGQGTKESNNDAVMDTLQPLELLATNHAPASSALYLPALPQSPGKRKIDTVAMLPTEPAPTGVSQPAEAVPQFFPVEPKAKAGCFSNLPSLDLLDILDEEQKQQEKKKRRVSFSAEPPAVTTFEAAPSASERRKSRGVPVEACLPCADNSLAIW